MGIDGWRSAEGVSVDERGADGSERCDGGGMEVASLMVAELGRFKAELELGSKLGLVESKCRPRAERRKSGGGRADMDLEP